MSTVSIRPSGSLLMGVTLMRKLGMNMEIDFLNDRLKITESKPPEGER